MHYHDGMTTIDSTSRFLAQLRSRVAAVARQSAIAKPGRSPSRDAGDAAAADVHSLVQRRVLAIGADDPDRRRKAFRVFLESVLTDELGQELVDDPAFYRIVDTVQRTMEQDESLLPAIEKAGELLLDSARKAPRA